MLVCERTSSAGVRILQAEDQPQASTSIIQIAGRALCCRIKLCIKLRIEVIRGCLARLVLRNLAAWRHELRLSWGSPPFSCRRVSSSVWHRPVVRLLNFMCLKGKSGATECTQRGRCTGIAASALIYVPPPTLRTQLDRPMIGLVLQATVHDSADCSRA